MRKALGLLLALALIAAACGDDDGGAGGSVDPADANSCEDLADVTVNLIQQAIDAVADMDMADFLSMADEGNIPPEFEQMETVGEEIEARAEQLGCTEEDAQELVCDRLGRIEAGSDVAELILTGVSAGC